MSDLSTMIGSMNKLEEFLLKLKLSISQLKILRDILLEVGFIVFRQLGHRTFSWSNFPYLADGLGVNNTWVPMVHLS